MLLHNKKFRILILRKIFNCLLIAILKPHHSIFNIGTVIILVTLTIKKQKETQQSYHFNRRQMQKQKV